MQIFYMIFSVSWKYQTRGEIEAPIVHDYDLGYIYVTAMNELPEEDPNAHPGYDLYAISPEDGELVYVKEIHETVAFPPYKRQIKGEATLNILTYNTGFLYQFDPEDGETDEEDMGEKGEYKAPSDGFPVFDNRDGILFFGYQTGGLAGINTETYELDLEDDLDGKLILTAMTLCSGQGAPDYEPFKDLYFGTQDEVVKYDVLAKEIVWVKSLKDIPALGAPVLDNWGQLLVG